jgi:hypothetical protein
MVTTIIEEGIYDIKTKESIKKVIFTFDGNRLTRQLFYNKEHLTYRPDFYDNYKLKTIQPRIDIIDGTTVNFKITLSDMLNSSIDYESILKNIKEKVELFDAENVAQRNIDAELPLFENPIITIK